MGCKWEFWIPFWAHYYRHSIPGFLVPCSPQFLWLPGANSERSRYQREGESGAALRCQIRLIGMSFPFAQVPSSVRVRAGIFSKEIMGISIEETTRAHGDHIGAAGRLPRFDARLFTSQRRHFELREQKFVCAF